MLQPKRHVGSVHPAARDNMSPVMLEHFVFTKSMQNMQVIAGTNGVTRYVMKVRFLANSKIVLKLERARFLAHLIRRKF